MEEILTKIFHSNFVGHILSNLNFNFQQSRPDTKFQSSDQEMRSFRTWEKPFSLRSRQRMYKVRVHGKIINFHVLAKKLGICWFSVFFFSKLKPLTSRRTSTALKIFMRTFDAIVFHLRRSQEFSDIILCGRQNQILFHTRHSDTRICLTQFSLDVDTWWNKKKHTQQTKSMTCEFVKLYDPWGFQLESNFNRSLFYGYI